MRGGRWLHVSGKAAPPPMCQACRRAAPLVLFVACCAAYLHSSAVPRAEPLAAPTNPARPVLGSVDSSDAPVDSVQAASLAVPAGPVCPPAPIETWTLPSSARVPAHGVRLSPDMLRAALRRRGDPKALRRVVAALDAGEKVDIVVFGGSVTAGVGTRGCELPGCSRPKKGHECRQCAWPSQLQAWLRKTYPRADVSVHNLAVRASSTSSGVKQLRVATFDGDRSVDSLRASDLVIHDCKCTLARTLPMLHNLISRDAN